jgi:hypothetical protein
MKVIDLGFRPHVYQIEAKRSMKRFSVLVCHRRWGKTVFAVTELVLAALATDKKDMRLAYVAPYRKQAKDIAWDYFKKFCSKIPGVTFNETELEVHFPNGAKIKLYGTDNAEALRGLYFDYVVLDEVADMPPHVWGEIIRPALSDRKGRCLFIGTPKGLNVFFELYNRGTSGAEKDWIGLIFPASKTVGKLPWLDQEELDNARRDLSPSQYRQEFECDFNASCDNTLITLDLIYAARGKHIPEHEYGSSAKVMGVDVARFGGDACTIQKRQGLAAFPIQRFVGIDNMKFASIVVREIEAWSPDAVFIDSGRGEGVIDRIRQIGFTVIEVPFGGAAIDDGVNGYANRRSEMWDSVRKWLVSGGAIPDDYELAKELASPTYTYDGKSRLKLEPKDSIKTRVGFSPDRADALALTFAEPVMASTDFRQLPNSGRCFTKDEFKL